MRAARQSASGDGAGSDSGSDSGRLEPGSIKITAASLEDLKRALGRLSRNSQLEFQLSGLDPMAAPKILLKANRIEVIWLGDEPAVIVGKEDSTLLSNSTYLWILTTELAEQFPLIFARRSQEYVKQLSGEYTEVICVVRAGFEQSLKWLRWIGFDIGKPQTFAGQKVCRCVYRRK